MRILSLTGTLTSEMASGGAVLSAVPVVAAVPAVVGVETPLVAFFSAYDQISRTTMTAQ